MCPPSVNRQVLYVVACYNIQKFSGFLCSLMRCAFLSLLVELCGPIFQVRLPLFRLGMVCHSASDDTASPSLVYHCRTMLNLGLQL